MVQGLRSHLPTQEPWTQPCSRTPPRAAGQLSPCATTPEPTLCNYWSLSALELAPQHESHHHGKPGEKAEAAFTEGDCPGRAAGRVELLK